MGGVKKVSGWTVAKHEKEKIEFKTYIKWRGRFLVQIIWQDGFSNIREEQLVEDKEEVNTIQFQMKGNRIVKWHWLVRTRWELLHI